MTTNQLIMPVTTETKGRLKIGGCDVIDLAEKYGTPLYVIDEMTIRTACREYKRAFSGYKNVQMMYASKALCTIATSQIIASEGFGFDVVSAGEIYTVYKSGADMSNVLFNGSNKTQEELDLAKKLGVGRISVDNFSELEMLDDADILLRITPGIECHTHEYIKTGQLDSKFGFDMKDIDKAVEIILKKNLRLKGLHAHIGSQIFETEVYGDEIEIVVEELIRLNKKFNLNLNEINIGGGLGVKYTEQDAPPSVDEIADVIISRLDKLVNKYKIEPPKLILEPGRSIVSPAGVTLYKLGTSKQAITKYFAIDGGMADNPRPSMYNAKYSAVIADRPFDNNSLQKVTIAGRFCESGDILLKNIELPNPKKNDILCVFNTGAYNFSMASNYNRVQKPAMVLVNNSQSDIIVLRETLDDLIAHDRTLK